MQKETLTNERIRKDLLNVVECRSSNHAEWRFTFIVPFTGIALLIGLITRNIPLALFLFAPAVYHIVRLIISIRKNRQTGKKLRESVRSEDFAVSIEKLSRIGVETIYEPNGLLMERGRDHTHKTVMILYFQSGLQWRVPETDEHYGRSSYDPLRPKAIDFPLEGENEFYFAVLKEDREISYAYSTSQFNYTGIPNEESIRRY